MKLPYKTYTATGISVEHLIGLILFLYPSLLFLVRGGMNASLFLLVIISIWLLATPRKPAWSLFDHTNTLFSVAMVSGVLVILISQLYHQDLRGRYFDSSSRFLIAIPVLMALRSVSFKSLSTLQYAFPLGAISAFVAVMMYDPTVQFVAETSFLNHIHLGDMALLLGFFSVFSINWIGRDSSFGMALKGLGFISGLAVSVLSGARGGWVAIPIFVIIFIYFRIKGGFLKKISIVAMILMGMSLVAFVAIKPVQERVVSIYSDLSVLSSGNADTSIGVRLQLWKAAFHLIAEKPILGMGAEGFARSMDALSASGFITPFAAEFGKGEVHNEILAQTVRFGVFGLVSILAVYFVPFYLFVRAVKTGSNQQVGAALMGMCVTLGFFVFGLTVETFNLKMTVAFYSLTVTVLLAIATHHSAEA
ncbi:MAG: O-antigen ligase family protein [Sideroxydans sp.]